MATARKPFGAPEESKKYDDGDPQSTGAPGLSLASLSRFFKTLRRRRIVFGLLALWILYLFIKNIPTDVPPVAHRYDQYGAQRLSTPKPPPAADREPKQQQQQRFSSDPEQNYDGPIKFLHLAASLPVYHSAAQDNILFAFSSVKSASSVMAAACSMAYQNRTKVHVAMMGREQVDPVNLLALNNIPDTECPITWHDAQPNHPAESTFERMQTSVAAAIAHMHKVLALQAIFFDHSSREDSYFRSAIAARSRLSWIPTINLPDSDAWMLALDAQSLRQWNTVSINIVVRVPPESSASLIRLLKSLQQADYGAFSYPMLTIELPAVPDQALLDFMAGYRWPPQAALSEQRFTVRRRPDPKVMDLTEASISTLESFYPATLQSHVLVLSPQVELSPRYYQALLYLLLEHQHGTRHSDIASKLLGISLESLSSASASSSGPSVSLSHTPGGNAALYFADKWNDLHNFVTLRIQSDPEWKKIVDSDLLLESMSPTTPAWLKAASEMMQAQGYYMLRPGLQKGASPLVTVHQELTDDLDDVSATGIDNEDLNLSEEGGVLIAMSHPKSKSLEKPMLAVSSVSSLFSMNQDKEAATIQIYDASGKVTYWDDAIEKQRLYKQKFAVAVGGCNAENKVDDTSGIAGLFCA